MRCFYLASGLRINEEKSKVYTCGVPLNEGEEISKAINCDKGTFPLKHLGLMVGAGMNKIESWKGVVDTFNRRLTNWKARNISFAGRVTLIKSVLSNIPTYYFSLYKAPTKVIKILEGIQRNFLWGGKGNNRKIRWIGWERIIASKKQGGLGIDSLKDINLALMLKWWWRLRSNINQLWSRVIFAVHGNSWGKKLVPFQRSGSGVWCTICKIDKEVHKKGIMVQSKLIGHLERGDKIRFWHDHWMEDTTLKITHRRIYEQMSNKYGIVEDYYIRDGDNITWNIPVPAQMKMPILILTLITF